MSAIKVGDRFTPSMKWKHHKDLFRENQRLMPKGTVYTAYHVEEVDENGFVYLCGETEDGWPMIFNGKRVVILQEDKASN